MREMRKSRIKRSLERIDPWIIPLMEGLDSPRALTVAILWRHGEYEQIARLKVQPTHYSTPRDYYRAAQATSLLRKFPDMPTGIDRKATALETFCGAEEKCELTNSKLSRLLYDGPKDDDDRWILARLEKARRLIHRIVGRAPRKEIGAFGPGVTSQLKGEFVKSEKYLELCECTSGLSQYLALDDALRPQGEPRWTGTLHAGTVVDDERITTVPKTAVTDRTIGIPVHLNAYVQRGLGIELREKLDRYRKVRLEVTPEYHEWLASVAMDFRLATIDLSSASDTVSYMLVRWLFPEEWLTAMNACRVEYYRLPGEEPRAYEKYSAMGNGYTFEVETLIFYALARSCGANPALCSTFGDDIIVEQEVSAELIDLLTEVGFEVNSDKSFVTGCFFESCGSDYFNGTAVRPFFLKSVSRPNDLFLVANAISRIAQWPNGPTWWRDKAFRRSYTCVLRLLGRKATLYVPIGFESNGVVVPFDKARPALYRHAGTGWQGYKVKALMFQSQVVGNDSLTGLRSSLDKLCEEPLPPRYFHGTPSPVKVKESVRGRGVWRVTRLSVFGPWDGPLGWI